MPQYVLVLGAEAMDHIPAEEMPDVDRAAHAVTQQAMDAGIWVCGGGLPGQRVSIVTADGTVTDGPQVAFGGLTVIEVPSRDEAHEWAARWATACRCDQEVWELGNDPKLGEMLRDASGGGASRHRA